LVKLNTLLARNYFTFLYFQEDIQSLKCNGADGFVFGILNKNGTINEAACLELLPYCSPLPVTFHRAFDLIPEPEVGLEMLIDLGFKRILTSGQRKTALDGVEVIENLVKKAAGRIVILAGAGVSSGNVRGIIDGSGVREVHGSCRRFVKSIMKLDPPNDVDVSMGPSSAKDGMSFWVTDSDEVRRIVQQL